MLTFIIAIIIGLALGQHIEISLSPEAQRLLTSGYSNSLALARSLGDLAVAAVRNGVLMANNTRLITDGHNDVLDAI